MRKERIGERVQRVCICDEIICDRCGKGYKVNNVRGDYYTVHQIHTFNIQFGYGSIHDGESCTLDFCEDCVIELIKSLKHQPVMKDGY